MTPFHFPGALETVLRLTVATLVGCMIGLNRDLRGKPAGLRTYALVTLGAALLALTSIHLAMDLGGSATDAVSRVMQGMVTGIGFLGAGVIVRNQIGHVHGLTSAATIWVASSLGFTCGIGYWPGVAVAVVLVFLVLMFGGPIEKLTERILGSENHPKTPDEKNIPT